LYERSSWSASPIKTSNHRFPKSIPPKACGKRTQAGRAYNKHQAYFERRRILPRENDAAENAENRPAGKLLPETLSTVLVLFRRHVSILCFTLPLSNRAASQRIGSEMLTWNSSMTKLAAKTKIATNNIQTRMLQLLKYKLAADAATLQTISAIEQNLWIDLAVIMACSSSLRKGHKVVILKKIGGERPMQWAAAWCPVKPEASSQNGLRNSFPKLQASKRSG
jgi:hypothetical protein